MIKPGEEVADTFEHDLEAIPVGDNKKQLMGRITIDDNVDSIKEEAEKDYQLAAGILNDVEANDGIFELFIKSSIALAISRITWWFRGVSILQDFEK